MDDLEKIATRRKALQAELAELDVAERVILSLRSVQPVRTRTRERSVDGIPAHQAAILAIIDEHGGSMDRAALLAAINEKRSEPMAETTYASVLSRLGTGGHIDRANGQVSRVQREMPM